MRVVSLVFLMFSLNACQAAPVDQAQAEPKAVASAQAEMTAPVAEVAPQALAVAQAAPTAAASACGGCAEGAKAGSCGGSIAGAQVATTSGASACGGCAEGAKAGACGGGAEVAKKETGCAGCGAVAAGGAGSSCAGDPVPLEAQSLAGAVTPLNLEGRVFGAGVSLPTSVAVNHLLDNVDTYEGKNVRVEGVVNGVCPKRGCWISIAGEEAGSSVRFKVRDGVMVFPVEDAGKYAVAQGVVRKIPLSLERSKAWARHQRDSYKVDIDPDAITEPMTLVRLDGTGAVIRDKK